MEDLVCFELDRRLKGLFRLGKFGHLFDQGQEILLSFEIVQNSSSWAFGPPTKHEKFLAGILLTLNFEP
jgi:hypothetical protein